MIPKLVLNDSYDFGEAGTSLVRQCRNGSVDQAWLTKRASARDVFAKEIANLIPETGKSIIHIIALGDEEVYKANRNGDGFSRADTVTAHTRFKERGHVFVDHKNQDPRKSVGEVLATAHNDPMSRVELLVKVDHDKLPDRYRSKLENDDDLAWSMGASVPFDVCSHCKHKAPTALDHCSHIKNHLMEILEDGTQIYMKNPDPGFFDISIVGRPADRIGYTLQKIAYSRAVVGGHELAQEAGLTCMGMAKRAVMTRLAEIEKRIPVKARVLDLKPATVRQLKSAVDSVGTGPVLRHLADEGCLLSPRDFSDILLGHKHAEQAEQAILSGPSLSQIHDPVEIESLDPGQPRYIGLNDDADKDIHDSCGCGSTPFTKRLVRVNIEKPAKLALMMDPAEADGLAQLYQHYKLAVAAHNLDRPDVLRGIAAAP